MAIKWIICLKEMIEYFIFSSVFSQLLSVLVGVL